MFLFIEIEGSRSAIVLFVVVGKFFINIYCNIPFLSQKMVFPNQFVIIGLHLVENMLLLRIAYCY